MFGYEGRDKIVPVGKGAGPIDGRTDQIDGAGVDEWLSHLKDDEVQFSLLKMTMGNRESKRPKFVMVSWIGPSVGIMKKAKVAIHGASVKEFIGRIHCEMTADDKEGLTFDLIREKVKSVMGSGGDWDATVVAVNLHQLERPKVQAHLEAVGIPAQASAEYAGRLVAQGYGMASDGGWTSLDQLTSETLRADFSFVDAHARQVEWARRVGAEPEPEPEPELGLSEGIPQKAERVRATLQKLTVMQLHRRAVADGLDAVQLETVMDMMDPKEAIIEMLLENLLPKSTEALLADIKRQQTLVQQRQRELQDRHDAETDQRQTDQREASEVLQRSQERERAELKRLQLACRQHGVQQQQLTARVEKEEHDATLRQEAEQRDLQQQQASLQAQAQELRVRERMELVATFSEMCAVDEATARSCLEAVEWDLPRAASEFLAQQEAQQREMIAQFMRERFADEETARRCLEEARWDVEQAMRGYMPPLPPSPVVDRTLGTSHFKAAYGEAEAPEGPMEIGYILTDLIRSYCKEEGIPWKSEGLPFLKKLQKEAMTNAQEYVDEIPQAAQRLWTSALQLRGREFCFILNKAVRGDDEDTADPAAVLTRAINLLCVTVGGASRAAAVHPPDYVCYRGGGFDNQFRVFFVPGREFRQPTYLATSFSREVAMGFVRRASMPCKVLWLVRIDRVRKCVHVNLVKRSNVAGEEEYLFAPYSAFSVISVKWGPGTDADPHVIELQAAPDNKAASEDLPLAPWS